MASSKCNIQPKRISQLVKVVESFILDWNIRKGGNTFTAFWETRISVCCCVSGFEIALVNLRIDCVSEHQASLGKLLAVINPSVLSSKVTCLIFFIGSD